MKIWTKMEFQECFLNIQPRRLFLEKEFINFLPLSFPSNQIHRRQHSLYVQRDPGKVFANNHSRVFRKSPVV